jgi:hypothetical protein
MQAKLPGAQHGIVVAVARAFDIPPAQPYGRPRSGGELSGRKTEYDNFEVQGKTGEKPALTRNREP